MAIIAYCSFSSAKSLVLEDVMSLCDNSKIFSKRNCTFLNNFNNYSNLRMLKLGSDFGTLFERSDIQSPDDIPNFEAILIFKHPLRQIACFASFRLCLTSQ